MADRTLTAAEVEGEITHEYKQRWLQDSPLDPARCKGSVPFGGRSAVFRQCLRRPWKDGWCRQHHPDTVAVRRAQSEARRKQKRARSPLVRLRKGQEEIARLTARVAKLDILCQQIVVQRDEAQEQLAEAEIGLIDYEKRIAELEARRLKQCPET